jgi:hypothetical protein
MSVIKIDFHPPNRTLRNFGLIGLVAFGFFAFVIYGNRNFMGRPLKIPVAWDHTIGMILAGLSVYCGLFALAAPAALRWLYVALSVITFPIGWVMSYVILTIMFYLILTPVALVFKLIGRDALHRRFEPAAPTYWIKRTPPATVKRYFRQF